MLTRPISRTRNHMHTKFVGNRWSLCRDSDYIYVLDSYYLSFSDRSNLINQNQIKK